jgi:hypothetical protein
MLNYTQTRYRNSTKWSDGKMKKGWKPFSPQKYINTGFRGK